MTDIVTIPESLSRSVLNCLREVGEYDELVATCQLPMLGPVRVKHYPPVPLVFDAQPKGDLAVLVGRPLNVGKANGLVAGKVSYSGNQRKPRTTGVGQHVEYRAQFPAQGDLGQHVTHQHRADHDIIL